MSNNDDNRDDTERSNDRHSSVVAIGQFRSGKFWFVALAFRDAEGADRVCAVPRRDCIKPFTLRSYLADAGAPLGESIDALREISDEVAAGNLPTVEPAATSGWHGDAYLFGDQFIGRPEGRLIVLAAEQELYPMEAAAEGSSTAWREALKDLPRISYALTLGACVAFASVMAGPLGVDPRIIHFYGTSTGGKTLLLVIARSTFGNPDRDRLPTWNTTAAAFEELAAKVRDHLLVIDEVTFRTGTIDDERMLRQIHYSFSTNQPKHRSRQYEAAHRPIGRGSSKLGLSTGELSYAEVARRVGTGRFRGAVVRAIDIPADLEYGLGVFRRLPDDLENVENGARIYAQRLESEVSKNYGRVGKYFIEHLIFRNPEWRVDARRRINGFIEKLDVGADGYSARFAEVFALAYAAGREAIAAKLVDWNVEDLHHAIERMYKAARQIAASPAEACESVLNRLRQYLDSEAKRVDRRKDIDNDTFDRYNAFLRDDPELGPVYLVKPSFIESLCGIELSSRDVAVALENLGVLVRGSAAIPTRQVMIGADRSRMRYYCIRASFVPARD